MKCTGARAVIECLVEQGVDTVFGYPGGAILNLYDELYKNQDRIRHIITAHEQGAAHAADGYSRSTGKTGVVMATSGPGATNLVTGIASAYMDSSPMVVITCNVVASLLGKDSFQEVDTAGITMPVTKHNYLVRDPEKLVETIREVFVIARSRRPGPVLIDILKDVTAAQVDYEALTEVEYNRVFLEAPRIRRFTAVPEPSDDDIEQAAGVINRAEKPLLLVGGGVVIADAVLEAAALAERAQIPAVVSLMGKTAFPSTHPLCLGMIGMHGTKAANLACNQSDLLIAVGARFSDRVISNPQKFGKHGSVLQIDIDPAEINKNVHVKTALVGDIRNIISRLLPLVNVRQKSAWNGQTAEWRKQVPPMYEKRVDLHPRKIIETVHRVLGDDTIITTEVGQHQMWTAQFYPFVKPRTFITSGGLGTMGFGTGAAIGAQIANPTRFVVHFAGDGSFMMNCNELATIAHYGLPIIIVLFHNGTLGMVRQWQNLFYGKRFSSTTLDFCPDFIKLADAYGIGAARITRDGEFERVFSDAAKERKPFLIDCVIDIDLPVLPMVPPGMAIEETMLDI
ncbi:MAG: biosynthetic-type acetolactate synthase large subunit [Spirochaetaceae bacterium]|jgi:acetolactate synthase-1/2/3 large subunit|nr:biosynthetic-type acetolactate synthase large subunit [Spirochaetaceae bacterium]